ncbi:nucleotide disphospho-sugar-binding domain-containing protein [Rathayibacter sp. YIM 133350]|uniref:glycosyltransferase n=1 Tax=Rathayibacter sp. YIM 133350 TaxID=3131992 RepID=UPI00307EEAB8
MVDVMVAVMPFVGHVAPLAAVVEAFLADGHTVRVYTGAAHAPRFRALGAEVVLWRAAPDFDENDLEAAFPALRDRKGPRQMLANVEQIFIATGARQLEDLSAAWDERPWDVIVADGLSQGAHLAFERFGSPWVTVGIVPLSFLSPELPPPMLGLRPSRSALGRARDAALRSLVRITTRGMQRSYERQRSAAGLPLAGRRFEQAWYSPQLFCASGVPELEFPRSDYPTRVVFVGALASPASSLPRPDWWDEIAAPGAPVVHVTQGTLNVDPDDLLRPAMTALGRQGVRIVAATGRRGVQQLPFPVPSNAYVADLLPYDDLLPRVDVMLTNGGWGGVLAALEHGIPLVVAGGDIDKPDIAARIDWTGAGISLRTGTPSPRAVLDGWRRVSSDASYRAAAERIGESLRRHNGPAEVVAHTLALLEGR